MRDSTLGGEGISHVLSDVVDAYFVSGGPQGTGHTQAHRAETDDANARRRGICRRQIHLVII
jgi:hypothetical protein